MPNAIGPRIPVQIHLTLHRQWPEKQHWDARRLAKPNLIRRGFVAAFVVGAGAPQHFIVYGGQQGAAFALVGVRLCAPRQGLSPQRKPSKHFIGDGLGRQRRGAAKLGGAGQGRQLGDALRS